MMFSEPVIGKDFFGREELVRLLHERTGNLKNGYRQNLAILGRELVGKSSCIHNFVINLDDKQILPVYVDVKPLHISDLAKKFSGSLLYSYLKSKSLKAKDDLRYLMKHCKKSLPRTVNAVKRVESFIGKSDFNSAFSLLLDLPDIIRQESGKNCIVILESFHNLNLLKVHKPFSVLGKKIMAQKNTLYILSSSSVSLAKSILANDLSLLFGNFEVINLKEFDFQTSRAFLDARLQVKDFPERYARFLISFTDGHPFYLDLISHELEKLKPENGKSKISKQVIIQSLDNLLYNPRGVLNLFFNSKLGLLGSNKVYSDCTNILLSVASGNNRLPEICDSINTPRRALSKPLSMLQELDMISRVGSFFRLQDKVFKFWLKTVYNRRQNGLSLDGGRRKDTFLMEVRRMVSGTTLESKKDLYEKVLELFRSFSNERISLGKKSFLLPGFQEIGVKFIGSNGPYIVGQVKGKNWICQIRERQIDENQVAQILQDCKKGKYRFDRKILISLNAMEENAKLAAKDAKVWIWDLSVLNLLLELYGLHQVVKY